MSIWSKIDEFFTPKPAEKEHAAAAVAAAAAADILLYAKGLITRPERVPDLVARVEKFKTLPPEKQVKEVMGLYLELEKYLIEKESLKKYTQESLREEIREKFRLKEEETKFTILFLDEWYQKLRYVELLIGRLKERLVVTLGREGYQRILIEGARETVLAGLELKEEKINWSVPMAKLSKLSKEEGIKQVKSGSLKLVSAVFNKLKDVRGEERARKSIEDAYKFIQKEYGFLPIAKELIQVLPTGILEKERIAFLSREELEEKVKERTKELEVVTQTLEMERASLEIRINARTKELRELAEGLDQQVEQRTKELQEKIEELEKFQKFAVGRELKMVELKEEIKRLEKKLKKNKG